MTDSNLQMLRAHELDLAASMLRPGMRILELGGGNGYQAARLTALGMEVTSIDIARAPGEMHHPVEQYDGHRIPRADGSFDVVFSSNVLEHVAHLDAMMLEIRRVLKDGGIAVHVLPTPAWRLWTSLAHYPYMAGRIWRRLSGKRRTTPPADTCGDQSPSSAHALGTWQRLGRLLGDGPHGEYSSALAELWYYSRRRWLGVFARAGFTLVNDRPCGILYTGYALFPGLKLKTRKRLASALGSATRIYALTKP